MRQFVLDISNTGCYISRMTVEHPIEKYCRITGDTVPKLAERAETTRQTLSRVIRGKQDVSMGLVRRLHKASDGVLTANDFLPEPAE